MGEQKYFNKPVTEIIKDRYSVRNYKNQELGEELQNQLIAYSSSLTGPFKPSVRFEMINVNQIDSKKDGKLGTYGFIKGAPSYIAGIVDKGERDLEQLGYVFEHMILYLTDLDIGTCWLGGTFTKDSFAKQTSLQSNEILPAISPLGYIEKKRRLTDTAIRFMAKSDKRKPWEELFFNEEFDKPLSKEEVDQFYQPLEMVRLAPSASNKQPWRVLKTDKNYHFYLKSDKGYSSALGFNIQRIDIGIAMCHFELTAKELGLSGTWKFNSPVHHSDNLEYVASWVID